VIRQSLKLSADILSELMAQSGTNDFMTPSEIEDFLGPNAKTFEKWYNANLAAPLPGIIDDWFNWYYGSSKKIGDADTANWKLSGSGVYFINPVPFQKPYLKRITMEKGQSLLVPVYSASASSKEYPSLKTVEDLSEHTKQDLFGIKTETFKVTLNGEAHVGNCVIRKSLLQTAGNVHHGGYWLLITAEQLGSGDHLLYFNADSKNYEMEVKLPIHVII
jgi:hypothetical protein